MPLPITWALVRMCPSLLTINPEPSLAESLPFTYKKDGWEYWTKTTKENNYSILLRKKIGDSKDKAKEYWNGDKEKKKLGASFFGIGDLSVSHDHSLLGYSLDINGSEYYTIHVRRIVD